MSRLLCLLGAVSSLALAQQEMPAAVSNSIPALPPTAATPPPSNDVIVVTASRMDRSANQMPGGVTLITSEQIAESGAGDIVQVLERLGGLYIRKTSGNPSQSEISMRGFGENSHGRVLILVDGQRLNEPDMRVPNLARVPAASVEKVEILYGAQSALYGNYAVSGVINIVTKRGTEDLTSVSITAGSEDTYGAHLHKSGSIGDTTYSADLDWLKSSGWRANSQFENYDVRAFVEHAWSEQLKSSLSAFYNWGDYGMPGALTKAQMKADPQQSVTPDDWARNQAWGFDLGSSGILMDWGKLSADFTGQRELRTFYDATYGSGNDYAIDSLAFTPKYEVEGTVFGLRNLALAGMDLGWDRLDYFKNTLATGAMLSDVMLDRWSGAAYGRDELFFTDELSLALGARGEAMRTRVSGSSGGLRLSDSDTETAWAADLAALWRPTEKQKYYVRGGTLYRFPFLDEIASYQGYGAGFNPDLEPEKGWFLEVGLSVEIVPTVVYDLRLYHMGMRDEIAYVYPNNVNLDRTRRDGLETAIRWTPERWGSLGLTYNLVNAEFDKGVNEGNDVPLVPKQVVTLDGVLNIGAGVSLLAAVRGVSDQYTGGDNGNVSDRIAGYATVDVGVRYCPEFVKGLSLLLACDNVFDKTYAESGYWGYGYGPDSFYPANGRMWRITMEYQF